MGESWTQFYRVGARALRRELIQAGDRVYMHLQRGTPTTRLPDFLIIGAMKAGTTALHECLSQHPEIFMTYVKEPSCFLNESPWLIRNPYVGTEERMRRLMFKGYQGQKRVGESSTTYTEAPSLGLEAPDRISREAPDMQFIYIMRNPFARIVSHYLHCIELGIYNEPMNDVLKRDKTFLERSLYFSQIKRYLEYFDKERFQLLFFEEFVKDPHGSLPEVCQFLNISEGPIANINTKQRNKTLVSSKVRAGNAHFEKDVYDDLITPIREDIAALEEFMGRSIDHWDVSEAKWCSSE